MSGVEASGWECGNLHHKSASVGDVVTVVEGPVEGVVDFGLVAWVVVLCEIGVCEGFFRADSFGNVEDEHFLQQIDGCFR